MKRPRMGQVLKAPRVPHLLKDRPWLMVAGCLVILAATGLLLVLALPRGNIDELLRAIDAAHAIPDEENAAKIYTELAWDPNLPSLDLSVLPQVDLFVTLTRPWCSVEFPQVAQWINDRRVIIDTLLAAGREPQCWFSVFEARWQAGKRAHTGCDWPELLVWAANRDLGEGRVDAGLDKLLCVFQMARHFLAQGSPQDYLRGKGMAWSGLKRFNRLVVLEDVPPEWLARLEAALPPIEGISKKQSRQLEEVRVLYEREYPHTLRARLKSIFLPTTRSRGTAESDLIFLGQCRTARILLALRRYRNDTGTWPADLRALRTRLPPEALRDPLSGKPFAYRLRDDGFLLYSPSANGTDEDSQDPDGYVYWHGR